MTCERCYKPLDEGEHGLGLCPLEPRRAQYAVWQDTIEGGLEISNGICNEDGTPKRYYSWSEIAAACKAKGVIPYHDVYAEGGNRTLEDARHREDWIKSDENRRARRDRDEIRHEKAMRRRAEEARQ